MTQTHERDVIAHEQAAAVHSALSTDVLDHELWHNRRSSGAISETGAFCDITELLGHYLHLTGPHHGLELAPASGFVVEKHHAGFGLTQVLFFRTRDLAWAHFTSLSDEHRPGPGGSDDIGKDRWLLEIVCDRPEPGQWARFYPVKQGDRLPKPD